MLKGLRGILEKGLQIAAPIIGGSMFGAPGAMFGSGIASLLSGDKAQDALIKAGMSGIAGYRGQGGTGTSIIDRFTAPKSFTPSKIIPSGVSESFDKLIDSDGMKKAGNVGSTFIDFITKPGGKDGKGPSIGGQLLATGLPAYLSYMAALQDAKKPGPQDASEYMSATDKFYGGQFERPPEDRRIKNLNYQGMTDGQPVYANQGGIMSAQQPVEYSAMTGQGIMGMAKGGDVFPRKTGQIEGPGTKTSDSIPAMLSDGEFVQRTDAVNGAGVMMGAKNANEAREKGADFMYALQDKLAKMGQRVA